MNANNTLIIDNREIPLNGERNLLEVARKAGIEIPTFCYHSELSIYGACRMCLVEVEGRGIVASCSTPPAPGMVVKSTTAEIRKLRRINLELLLAAHNRECTTCGKSGACSLQNLSRTMGVDSIRYKHYPHDEKRDTSSLSLIRDPAKCVLCGDCVRFCDEIQSVGAIDFAYRGAQTQVVPAFHKGLAEVDCVNCGQCARVCPTGALTLRPEIESVWEDLNDENTVIVAQVAPAIRVAIGEHFGMPEGEITTGMIATALHRLGFDKVYDTCFTADLTVLEEGTEFLNRVASGGKLPLFTSCCPAWVKFVEQYYPDLLDNVSTCKSPQQMFGALAREMLPGQLQIGDKRLSIVSVMPCTAKKYEARRKEFADKNGIADVNHVITTQELAQMIDSAGIRFNSLKPSEFDDPFGTASGAGTIFGLSGGVTEAVVRYVHEKVEGKPFDAKLPVKETKLKGVREITLNIGGNEIKTAVVYGLAAAREICRQVRAGTCQYSIIEVMACPGGCINGAGQPVSYNPEVIRRRGESLYAIDRTSEHRTSQSNPALIETYEKVLGKAGGPLSHKLLHTHYIARRRFTGDGIEVTGAVDKPAVTVEVCLGTNCCLHGAHDLLNQVTRYVINDSLQSHVSVKAGFCFERCGESPVVRLNGTILGHATFEKIKEFIENNVAKENLEKVT
ncbi:MAG: 2Fe-2S iron-sulfur cluster binding domain-containing protein [Fibrobacter sp.]|nr:2Fe-2S iron-sulfur cluster binding domain-containing protein [Fibrobacter sp.]